MRLLLASDLHYALPQFDWVLSQADDYDLVVLAGDHLSLASAVPLETQIVVLQTFIEQLGERCRPVVCSGNHDLTGVNHHGEKWAPWIVPAELPSAAVDGSRLDLEGVRVTVCPWWDGALTRDDVAAQLEADSADRPSRWVWIYHYPPDLSQVSWTGRRHIGDADLRGWIDHYQPDVVLTGHIHDAPFRDGGSWIDRVGPTWVMNSGVQPGPIPPHVSIDLAAGYAEWWSPYGTGAEQLW